MQRGRTAIIGPRSKLASDGAFDYVPTSSVQPGISLRKIFDTQDLSKISGNLAFGARF
jgi:hypothetical protein